jgi:phosphatidylserine decarboxylase
VITHYGIDAFIKIVVALAIINIVLWLMSENEIARWSVGTLTVVFLGFTLNFFRDPDRTAPADERAILSPADGKVVMVKNVEEPEFIGGPTIQVSVFMSPLNVHVNRFPISGTVKYFKYIPGKYVVAFEEKSSEVNERTHIGIENGRRRVLFKQIAGFIARRIVANVDVGMDVKAGERFGMIKFGSRVDVLMSPTAEILVEVGQHVVAGETILARL